jgi:hypothetical protein
VRRETDGSFRAGPRRKALRAGVRSSVGPDLVAMIDGKDEEGLLIVRLEAAGGDVEGAIERHGEVPLPPYVRRRPDEADALRYQTVFARTPGAVAAPTAGLHLTEELLDRTRARGIAVHSVTLHVGLGTFAPVTVDDLDQHPMHTERYVSPETASGRRHRAHEGPIRSWWGRPSSAPSRASCATGRVLRPRRDAPAPAARRASAPSAPLRRTSTSRVDPARPGLASPGARDPRGLRRGRSASVPFFSYGDAMLIRPARPPDWAR